MNTTYKKILGTTLFASLSLLSLKAQQTREVGDFTGIRAGDAINVVITQSEANSLKVDADEKIQGQIKTEVKDGILSLSTEGNINTDKTITVTVGIKNLSSLEASGAANVESTNQLVVDKLKIESNGAGNVSLELKANDVQANVSGAGNITLKGTAQNLDASLSGAGNLKASNLEADRVKAKVSGLGSAKVHAKLALDADVSGVGDIIYKGNPAERNVNINGLGSVRESKSGNGEETASDTTRFKLGNKKLMIIGDDDEAIEQISKKDSTRNYNEKFKHWQGFDIGVNGFLTYDNSLDLPASASFLELNYGKSAQFGLNLFEKDFHIWKNYINIVTGFGFDFNHYAFANKVTLRGDTTYLAAYVDSSNTVSYKKNKLNATYIRIPLMVEINTSKNPKRNFHIAGGVEAAYLIHSVAKQRYDIGDTHYRSKTRDDFNMEPFRFSAMARIGYNDITLFANYGLNRLFKKDKGPQVYPFTVGVTFSM
jgi:hypothetical protein